MEKMQKKVPFKIFGWKNLNFWRRNNVIWLSASITSNLASLSHFLFIGYSLATDIPDFQIQRVSINSFQHYCILIHSIWSSYDLAYSIGRISFNSTYRCNNKRDPLFAPFKHATHPRTTYIEIGTLLSGPPTVRNSPLFVIRYNLPSPRPKR